jgi:two-component system response regulator
MLAPQPPSSETDPAVILVAEDSKYDRMILEEAFKEVGCDVGLRFVTDGEDALDYLHRRNRYTAAGAAPRPLLLLLDLNMPRMDGSEALRALRADAELRALPVIILSTSDNPRQIVQAYANGANAFMTKPGSFDEFVALLRGFAAFWLDIARLPAAHAS